MNNFKLLTILFLIISCSHINQNQSRTISSLSYDPKPSNLENLDWHFVTTNFKGLNYVYTPFFVEDKKITLFTGGAGSKPNNGVLKLESRIESNNQMKESFVIKTGPDLTNYNYFRAPRVAKVGNELWMLVEISGCYEGCDTKDSPKTLGVYRSSNNGSSWTFLDYMTVDGNRFIAKWFGHVGLIYRPDGSKEIDLKDLTKNKFVTIGENRDIYVSADGIHYTSIPMNHPFPKDRLVFASIAQTPFGYHLMTCANWNDKYYTTTVRHLFSKDLINWIPIESSSALKNPVFYKGVHLSYDEKSNKLWALSPCGTSSACSLAAWITPKDFSLPTVEKNEVIPVGEYIHYKGNTAMILEHSLRNEVMTYKIRFWNGTIDSGYTKEMFTFPLQNYNRQGCVSKDKAALCIGDAVYVQGKLASIIGLYQNTGFENKFALRFSNGVVDTGYLQSMLQLP